MILTCPFCNAKLRSSDQDCPACKQRIGRRCPSCSETVPANAGLCKYCGEELPTVRIGAKDATPARPDIEFLEEAPAAAPARRECRGGRWLALLLFVGLVASAFVVRTDCVACASRPEHEVCLTTHTSVSHCGRRFCKEGKTPLWVTVYERMGGHVKACGERSGRKAPSPDACCPARDDDWH